MPGQMPFGYLGSTGTEAMEAALKLARLTTGRPGLVGMQMGYHGMSVGTLSISGIPYWREGFSPLLEPVRLVPFGDLEAVRKAVDPTTAAVFLEPVQWASACSVAPAEYLRSCKICDKTGALLIWTRSMWSGTDRRGSPTTRGGPPISRSARHSRAGSCRSRL